VLKAGFTQILQRMHDRKERVQEVACSAFAALEEKVRSYRVPYLEDIVVALVYTSQHYQAEIFFLYGNYYRYHNYYYFILKNKQLSMGPPFCTCPKTHDEE